jgi:hypothetical protein
MRGRKQAPTPVPEIARPEAEEALQRVLDSKKRMPPLTENCCRDVEVASAKTA